MNTEKMMQFEPVEPEMLHSVTGGSWYFPLLPSYEQIASSICGFMDGIMGRKNKGRC